MPTENEQPQAPTLLRRLLGAQVKLMTQYLRSPKFAEFTKVPDPYFGGAEGFELVRVQAAGTWIPPFTHIYMMYSDCRLLLQGLHNYHVLMEPREAMASQVLDLLEDAAKGLLSEIEGS